ncbi:diphthine--ammonia ligase-like isoform X1 [Orbicella faveolata]|uniref:diphthine--ammonia ligase-like isoform X1 n=2 Tax=Orbicella faveolata TaxID=48498 RepID=UPI0009E59C26|nr:diphthine--ammonia ligase-like isoform X1 [Orbicella faveolata]
MLNFVCFQSGQCLKNHTSGLESLDKLQIQLDDVTNTEQDRTVKCKEQRIKIPARSQEKKKDHILYSRCGNYIWVSGIYGHRSVDGKMLTIEDVTRNVLQHLQDTLTNLGANLCDGMIVHLFVKNMDDFAKINAVYKTFLRVNPPARACIQLNLPEDIAIQADCLVYAAQSTDTSVREAMHVQSISHWAPANIGPYSQATKAGDTIFVSGSIGLWPPTMSMIQGGISQEAPLSLQHVERVITALNPGESLKSIVHGFCFLTSPAYVSVAKTSWHQMSNPKSRDSIESDQSPVGLMSYIIVPALPKNAQVEWHVVALENQIQHQYDSTTVHSENFTVGVQSIGVRGNSNYSVAVNIAVGEFFNCANHVKGSGTL